MCKEAAVCSPISGAEVVQAVHEWQGLKDTIWGIRQRSVHTAQYLCYHKALLKIYLRLPYRLDRHIRAAKNRSEDWATRRKGLDFLYGVGEESRGGAKHSAVYGFLFQARSLGRYSGNVTSISIS